MALARELRSNGHEALLLSRRVAARSNVDGFPVGIWDGRSGESLAAILDEMDALVNLSGESIGKSPWTQKRKQIIVDSRLQPARAITEAWSKMKSPPRVLLQSSAMGIYGSTDQPVDESSKLGNGFLAEVCKKWEASTEAAAQYGTRRVITRSGVVLDRNQGILPQMMLPFRLFVGGPMGTGRQWLSWIHITDEARAMRRLLEDEGMSGIYNLTCPHPVTNAEFGREVGRYLHRPYWFRMPAFALKLVLGEMGSLVLEGQIVLPTRLTGAGFEFLYPDIGSALSELLSSKHQNS